MHIKDICRRSLATCHREMSAFKIAQMMREQFVEEVVVVEERAGHVVPVGIVTFRDMVVRVVAGRADPDQASASDIMTNELALAHEMDLVYAATTRMRDKEISRLIVVDTHDALVGVLTADDLSEYLTGELVQLARISPHHVALRGKAAPAS